MRRWSQNEPILVKDARGKTFRAAVSHTEQDGEHTVALATSPENRNRLRESADTLIALIARQHQAKQQQVHCYLCTAQGYAQPLGTNRRESGRLTQSQMEKLYGKSGTPQMGENPQQGQEATQSQESGMTEGDAEPEMLQRESPAIRPRMRL